MRPAKTHALLLVFIAAPMAAAEPCPPGYYSPTGQSPCQPCPPNTSASTSGSTVCTLCGPHSASPAGSATCGCEAGYFRNAQGDCQLCPEGANCTGEPLCPPGTYSATGYAPCINCPAGRANPAYGAISCIPCQAGSFSASAGATQCLPCAAGTASNPGAQTCLACPDAQVVFLSQPVSIEAIPGEIFDIDVDTPATPPGYESHYQWRHNAVPVQPEGRIIGITSNRITVTDAIPSDSGAYDVLVTWSPCPPVRSEPAGAYIGAPTCAGDADGNGAVNFADITSVLASFNAICR